MSLSLTRASRTLTGRTAVVTALLALSATSTAHAAAVPAATSVTAKPGPSVATPISVNATFRAPKRRGGATPAIQARVVLTGGAAGSGRRSRLGTFAVPALSRGRSITLRADFTPAAGTKPGKYQAAVCLGERHTVPCERSKQFTLGTVTVATPTPAPAPTASPAPATATPAPTPAPTPTPVPEPAVLAITETTANAGVATVPAPVTDNTTRSARSIPAPATPTPTPVPPASPTSTATFTVTNTGGSTSGTPSVQVSGANAGEFSVSPSTNGGCNGPIAAGASCTYTVTFAPTSHGARTATATLSASPGGGDTVSLAGDAKYEAVLKASYDGTDLTHTPVGYTSEWNPTYTRTVTVTNIGEVTANAPVTGALTAPDAAWTVDDSSCSAAALAPGASCTVKARFHPSATGIDNRYLMLTSGDQPVGMIQIQATGVSPAMLDITTDVDPDLGLVFAGAPAREVVVTVENIGGSSAGYLTLSTETDDPYWQITNNGCEGIDMYATRSCTFTMSATVPGTFTGPPTPTAATVTIDPSVFVADLLPVEFTGTAVNGD